MKLVFERANINDISKLIDVQNKSFYDDYILYGECPAYNESEKSMNEYINTCIVYKILVDDEIVGDIIVRRNDNNNYYLRVISIIPEVQNLGIGSKAINFIESDNPNANEWSLITPYKSYRNHHFYEKCGYKKVGEEVHSDVLTLWKYRKSI